MPRIVPADWMPDAKMTRIHLHWTAGHGKANATDRAAYHILIEADGALVRGDRSIAANARPLSRDYARHTAGANTGAIGVSLCCMAGVNLEKDYLKSPAPMTEVQWRTGFAVLADLADHYEILVTPVTVLTHAEVQPNLGIPQDGKWDVTRLSFDPTLKGAQAIGRELRAQVAALIEGDAPAAAGSLPDSLRAPRYRVTGVHPARLNFRRGPGGERVGALPERTVVERLGVDGEWWRVRTRAGHIGYVHSGFLTPVDA